MHKRRKVKLERRDPHVQTARRPSTAARMDGEVLLEYAMGTRLLSAGDREAAQLQGMLTKRGDVIHSWRERLFLLWDNVLFYFRPKSDEIPAGVISLRGSSVEGVTHSVFKRDHCFALKSTTSFTGRKAYGNRVYFIQAPDAKRMEQWLAALREASGTGSRLPLLAPLKPRPSTTDNDDDDDDVRDNDDDDGDDNTDDDDDDKDDDEEDECDDEGDDDDKDDKDDDDDRGDECDDDGKNDDEDDMSKGGNDDVGAVFEAGDDHDDKDTSGASPSRSRGSSSHDQGQRKDRSGTASGDTSHDDSQQQGVHLMTPAPGGASPISTPNPTLDASRATLWHVHGSASTRCLWLIRELGVDVVVKPVNTAHPPQGLLKVSPQGNVPCFCHNGNVLTHPIAIMLYVCEVWGASMMPQPHDSDYGLCLQMCYWAASRLDPSLQPALGLHPDDPIAKAYGKSFTRAHRGTLERALYKRQFLLLRGFTVADVAVGYALFQAKEMTWLDKQPFVRSYVSRLTQRPAFVATLGHTGAPGAAVACTPMPDAVPVLYHDQAWASTCIRWLIGELGANVSVVAVHGGDATNDAKWVAMASVHDGQATLPMLVHDDVVLTHTGAILTYVREWCMHKGHAAVAAAAAAFVPRQPSSVAAQHLQRFTWAVATLGPLMDSRSDDAAVTLRLKEHVLPRVAAWLSDSGDAEGFLLPCTQPTLLDVYVGCALIALQGKACWPLGDPSRCCEAYTARLRQRSALCATLEAGNTGPSKDRDREALDRRASVPVTPLAASDTIRLCVTVGKEACVPVFPALIVALEMAKRLGAGAVAASLSLQATEPGEPCALVRSDVRLWHAAAMACHVVATLDADGVLAPVVADRARYAHHAQTLHWLSATLEPLVTRAVAQVSLSALDRDVEVLETSTIAFHDVAAPYLEARLQQHDWLCSLAHFGLVDAVAARLVMLCEGLGWLEAHPVLETYAERLQGHSAVRKAIEGITGGVDMEEVLHR